MPTYYSQYDNTHRVVKPRATFISRINAGSNTDKGTANQLSSKDPIQVPQLRIKPAFCKYLLGLHTRTQPFPEEDNTFCAISTQSDKSMTAG